MKLDSIIKCKRISIIGMCGSGKSTLAKMLGEILGIPYYHIDCLYHKPDMQIESKEGLAEKLDKIINTDKWIIDGNYKNSMANRFALSDLIIFLDFSQEFCIQSAIDRQSEQRVGLPEYYIESEEALENLINFHIKKKFLETREGFIDPLKEQYKEKVIEFKTREEVNEFIKRIRNFIATH